MNRLSAKNTRKKDRTMIANINPDTGIAYGYISAHALDQDLITELFNEGTSLTANEAYAEWLKAHTEEIANDNETLSPEEAKEEAESDAQDFWDSYEGYEEIVEGTKDGVHYCSSYLGGALNFFIFFSPVVTENARLASPCVPNAGILDTLDGNVQSYDVPSNWRHVDD